MQSKKQIYDAINPPDLIEVVQRGLLRLEVRKLRWAPTPEDIPLVAEVMTEDLVRVNKAKHIHVSNALEWIGGNDKEWPQPARVIEVMKILEEPRSTYIELPAPDRKPGVAEANLQKLKVMAMNCVDNGQRKSLEKKSKEYMESECGTMPLTDEQWIEARRIFVEVKANTTEKGAAMRAQNEYFKSINYGIKNESSKAQQEIQTV